MENPGTYRHMPNISTNITTTTNNILRTVVAEVPTVISLLTQSPPSLQEKTIERFFVPSAAFVHPLCRIGSFKGSRWVILKIYQWYKILSPRIELEVHSVGE